MKKKREKRVNKSADMIVLIRFKNTNQNVKSWERKDGLSLEKEGKRRIEGQKE